MMCRAKGVERKEREHFLVTLGSAPSLCISSKLPGCLFHREKLVPNDHWCYCWRGPLEASSRSRIWSNVTASISPRAYL